MPTICSSFVLSPWIVRTGLASPSASRAVHEHAAIAGIADVTSRCSSRPPPPSPGATIRVRAPWMVRTGASSPVAPPRKITTAAASGLGAMISSLRRVIRDSVRRPAEMRGLSLDDPFRCDVSICQPGKCRDTRLADSIGDENFLALACRRPRRTDCRTRSSPFRPARCG